MGTSKAIGPGHRIAASLQPTSSSRAWAAASSYDMGAAFMPFQLHTTRHPCSTGRCWEAGKRTARGKTPGRSGDLTSVDQKSMSPPPPGMAGAFSFSGFSAITASVVRNRPAIDAAFCSADRVTFAGSMMPARRAGS